MKKVKNILLLLTAIFTLGCSQTIVFEDVQTPTPTPTPKPEPEPEPDDKQLTSVPYAVGDYYYDGTKEGVVFEVWDNGNSGKIVSMTESTTALKWSSDETEQKRLIGADSETDGAANMAVVKAISGWESKYPAFKWCADLGEGWYMPAIEELKVFTLNDAVHDAVNNTLSARGGTKLYDIGESKGYWSSTEYDSQFSNGEFCARYVNMFNGDTYISNKSTNYCVRAVTTFGDAQQSDPTPEPTEPANNEIWYTSIDGKVVTPAETGYFNVSITSNTYSNGKGVITFSGPLTTVGEDEGEEPFANCAHNLKSVVLPNGLKTIGYGAFSLCSGLESVTIPESVTYIKSGAFYDCNKLTAIALPSGLLRIDDNAFASCDLLESVTIPDSVTLIGRGAFSGEKLRAFYGKYASSDNKLIVFDGTVICSALGGLTEYSIPNVVKIIDFCAFSGYKNIKKFTIPNSVVSIGDGSFSYCTSLQDITIPDSVTEIVGGSFFNCTSLTSAILSKNLTKIGDATFMNCSKLKNIYCSAVTPPQCGKDLFEGVTTDFKIYVPASSVSAYKSASGWSTYADAIVADPASVPTPEPTEPANNEIWYTSTDGNVVIPYDADVFGASIVSNTYNDGKGVITFDGEITQIGKDAFSSRPKLTSIIIPESVTLIGSYAFNCCSGLIGITLPDGVTSIGNGAFNDCSSLTSITIPDSIIEIGGRAFEDCSSLTSITIPNNITSLENWTFKNCSNLKEVYYTGDLSAWCKILFEGDTANPMSNSAKLYIDNKEIAEVTIPSDITEIKNFTFSYCRSLTSITITDNVTSIGSCAFYNCDGLTSIIIPDSVTEIDSWAFRDCGYLESVTIGNFVTHIGYYAFMDNHRLKKVYCRSIAPPYIEPGLFDNNASDRKIYVPASSVSAYKSASGWSTYADAIVADPASTPDLDYSTATDLSVEGTANCYLVKAAGTYKFKAVKGNSAQSVGTASSADVLWESFGTSTTPNVGDLIASATYKDGYVYFATPNTFKNGNASIAVRDTSSTILWSWHIWCSTEGWTDDIYPNNAGTMMDRNLGATSATPGDVGAFGLLYQWGRKDPFLGSCYVLSNTLAVSTGAWSSVTTQQTVDYATANPMTFVRQNSEWCTGDGAENSNYTKRWTESEKTMYDPCPVGYRVPDGGENGFWATALGTSDYTDIGTTWDSTNKGRHWTLSDGTAAWYPAVGYRSYGSGVLSYVGSDGYCWSASPDPGSSSRAYSLCFLNGYVTPANHSTRGSGQSVRCVSTTATSEPTPGITSAPYAVGDYYNDGTKEGVVFEVSADGTSGKIVSMMQSTGTLQWSSDETEQKRLIGADSETDGAANMAVVKAISGWETKYPAFKWCADLGDGWYLPAKEELLTIYDNKDKLNTNLTDKLSTGYYWSSTEYDYQYSNGYFCARSVRMSNGGTTYNYKSYGYYERAVSAF